MLKLYVEAAKPKSHQDEVMMAIVRQMMYLGIAASLLVTISALTMKLPRIWIVSFVAIFLMGAVRKLRFCSS